MCLRQAIRCVRIESRKRLSMSNWIMSTLRLHCMGLQLSVAAGLMRDVTVTCAARWWATSLPFSSLKSSFQYIYLPSIQRIRWQCRLLTQPLSTDLRAANAVQSKWLRKQHLWRITLSTSCVVRRAVGMAMVTPTGINSANRLRLYVLWRLTRLFRPMTSYCCWKLCTRFLTLFWSAVSQSDLQAK